MKKLLLILIIVMQAINAFAQNIPDTIKLIPRRTYVFTKMDGYQFIGTVQNQSDEDVMVDKKGTGVVLVHKADIKKVEPYIATQLAEKKFENRNITYGELGVGLGTHLSGKLAMNFINSNNRVTTICVYYSSHRDPGCPSDFSPGLFEQYPQQKLIMFGVMEGKVFYARSADIRYAVKGGLSAGIAYTPTAYAQGGGWLSDNYTYDLRSQFTPGIILNPAIELPVKSIFGMSFGFYANINLVSSVFGGELNLLFGKVRNKRPGETNKHLRRHRIGA